MTLNSAIVFSDYQNPKISPARPINVLRGIGGSEYFSATGPKGAVQLKLTKPLTVINAQGAKYINEMGTILYATPLETVAANNAYIYTTEGKGYILTVGVNAELYSATENNSNSTTKQFPVALIGLSVIAIVIIYTMNKL
jgi:hypothetical protein